MFQQNCPDGSGDEGMVAKCLYQLEDVSVRYNKSAENVLNILDRCSKVM